MKERNIYIYIYNENTPYHQIKTKKNKERELEDFFLIYAKAFKSL